MSYIYRHESELRWSSSTDAPLRVLRTKLLLDGVREGSRAYRFGLAKLERGAATDPYSRHEAELIYILQGQARVIAGSDQVILGEHGSIYFPAGSIHSIGADGAADLLYAFTIPCERSGSVEV